MENSQSQQASTNPSVSTSHVRKVYTNDDVVQIRPTTRKGDVWSNYDLCVMIDGVEKARCKKCSKIYNPTSNTTLRTHKSGCSAVSQNDTSQGTIGADGQVFIFDNDAVRLDFTKFVIQQALPFNHFDNVKLTEIIKRRLQPRYQHVSRTTLRSDAFKLWETAKKDIIDGFRDYKYGVSITTDTWTAPHDATKRQRTSAPTSELGQYMATNFLITLRPEEFTNFDILAWWKEREIQFPILSAMARDLLTVQASTVASESAFSISGRIISERRSRLTPESVEVCVCLKDYLDGVDRVQHETSLEGPILEDVEETIAREEVDLGISPPNTELDEGRGYFKEPKKIPIGYKEPKDNEKHYGRSKFQLTLFAKYEVDVISSFESKNQLLRAVDSRLSELKEQLADTLNKAIDTSCSPKDISKLEEDIRQMKRLKTWLNFRENVEQLTIPKSWMWRRCEMKHPLSTRVNPAAAATYSSPTSAEIP
ncbi:zinc finger BED domain-containing protein RICESLEEPER 2 [Tanacetum coccineum]